MAPRKRMAALVRHVLTAPPSLGGDWVLLLYLDNESVIACPVAEADHSRPVVVLARADELEVLGPGRRPDPTSPAWCAAVAAEIEEQITWRLEDRRTA